MTRGVIFDLDGTIVDNMAIHAEAFGYFAERHGLPPLTLADRKRLDGRRNSEILPDLFGRPLSDAEQIAFAEEKETIYRGLAAGRLVPLPGLLDLLGRLTAHGIPAAIATSSPLGNVRQSLEQCGLRDRLPTIVRGDQVERGKPYPDIFLAAAEQIGVAPTDCVAFEDAPIGVRAARAAGMWTVAVLTSFTPDVFADPEHGANEMVTDFAEYLRRHPEM